MNYLLSILLLGCVFGLAACDGGGNTATTMTGTQKCTITVNGEEKPCP